MEHYRRDAKDPRDDKIEELEAELKKANERIKELEGYAKHKDGCDLAYLSQEYSSGCTCGLDKLLKGE